MKFKKHFMMLFSLAILFIFSGGASNADDKTKDSSLNKVIEEAKKEGKLTVYASYKYKEGKEIHAGFQKKYPFIDIEHLEMGAGDVTTRILMESRAGTSGADVGVTGAITAMPLIKDGFLKEVDWVSLGVESNAIDSPYQVTIATITYMLAWNSELVPSAESPKNWEDLLDPKWKGKIGVWVSPYPFTELIPAWGEARVTEYLKQLMKNEPVIIRGGAEIPSRLAAGEVSIAVVIDATVKSVVEKGAPIKWIWPNPIPVGRYDAFVTKLGNHPNAAALFCTWLSSLEGATAYEKATWRGNVFVDGTPISQKTKGKQYSCWGSKEGKNRMDAAKRLTKIIVP